MQAAALPSNHPCKIRRSTRRSTNYLADRCDQRKYYDPIFSIVNGMPPHNWNILPSALISTGFFRVFPESSPPFSLAPGFNRGIPATFSVLISTRFQPKYAGIFPSVLISTRFQPGDPRRPRASPNRFNGFLRTLSPGPMRTTVIDHLEETVTTQSPTVAQKLSRTY